MRDKTVNNKAYFMKLIAEKDELILNSIEGLNNSEYPSENIPLIRHRIYVKSLEKLVAMYSMGICMEDLKTEYSDTMSLMTDGWDEYLVKFKMGRPEVVYDQYKLNEYCYMIWMLSFSELLNVSSELKNRLGYFIERDKITDELILGLARIEAGNPTDTTYKPFSELFKGQDFSNIDEKVLSKYLSGWYKNTKLLQWHNYKSSIERSRYYFGYWSFESAAIVAINGLNDSSFRHIEYYPKDLVDYYRSNHPA